MGTLTQELKRDITYSLANFIADNSCSAAKIASDLKVNEAYISQILNYKYAIGKTEIKDKYFSLIAQYVGVKLKKDYWQRCDTRQSLMIEAYIAEAKDFSMIKTVIGETGVGKTFTVDAFVDAYKQESVYRITVGQLHTVVNVIDDLLIAMNIDLKGDKVSKLRKMQEFLKDKHHSGKTPLIIIDEAENLKLPVIGLLKQLYDMVVKTRYCGIVLIGTSQLTEKIEKMVRRNKIGVPQFLRRIKAGMEIIKSIDWWKDKAFINYLKELVGEHSGIIPLLKELANNYGEVNDYIEPAMRDAERLNEEFNYEFFVKRYRLR